jgi:hypothetical protein
MCASQISFFRHWRRLLAGVVAVAGVCAGSLWHGHADAAAQAAVSAQAHAIPPLSPDDVSVLFPAPTRPEDFAKLIAVRDLTSPDPQDPSKRDLVWPIKVFDRLLAIAASPAAQVSGKQIGLPAEAQSIDNWFIAGIRVDAGAPGLSSDVRGQFGQSPGIRLIVQPVTRNQDGTPKVDDIAVHLIFDFTLAKPSGPAQPGCAPRPLPDVQAFNAIVTDLVAPRTKLSSGQLGAHKVTTSGVPLGVHPGLADPTTEGNLRQEIQSFLEKHISPQRLDAMAITGLPAGAPAPWIFLSFVKVPPGLDPSLPNGGFDPVQSPTLDGQQFALMLEPAGQIPRVVPEPHTNNLNPITCKNAAVPTAIPPVAERSGVATAELFVNPPPPPDRTKQVLDVIADPSKSHFFNTDCASWHTETRRAMELLNVKDIPGIDPAALPNGSWDVRNFGWSPAPKGSVQATVTRRTAAETATVVTFINSELLATQAPRHN